MDSYVLSTAQNQNMQRSRQRKTLNSWDLSSSGKTNSKHTFTTVMRATEKKRYQETYTCRWLKRFPWTSKVSIGFKDELGMVRERKEAKNLLSFCSLPVTPWKMYGFTFTGSDIGSRLSVNTETLQYNLVSLKQK